LVTGRYRLVESIGQGGMGRVWRAADEILDREVAVKEMRIDGLDAEDARTRRERTLREARATARIDHPNVVRIYDVVDEGERLWIVMELVAGRSLERIMAEEGPLGPGAAARIGIGLVTALRQVHARGVLHRDIKPGNVLVEGDGRRVVLTDFGIAAIQDAKALTMVGMLVGSPDYMAPERISGRPQGPPSDIWSLGATLCAALAGRSPFSRDTTLATLHAVLYEEPELPASAGPLHTVLAALLEKDPDIRPDLETLETALRPVAFPTPTPTVAVRGGEELREPDGESETPGTSGTRTPPEAPSASETGTEPGGAAAPETAVGPDPDEPEYLSGGAPEEPDPEPSTPSVEVESGPGPSTPSAPTPPSPASVRTPTSAPTSPPPPPDTDTNPDTDPGPSTPTAPPARDQETPQLPWSPRESPTPAYLDASRVPTAGDPRRPAPETRPDPDGVHDAIPQQRTAPARTQRPATAPATDTPATPATPSNPVPPSIPSIPSTSSHGNASTEAASSSGSEVHSATPVGHAPGAFQDEGVTPRRGGVSLVRSEAETERRPMPESPSGTRPGELPGPARPAHPVHTDRPADPGRPHRRTGLIATGAAVTVGAIVAVVVLLMNSGSPGGNQAGGSPTPSASASGSVTPSPTVEGTARPQSLPPGAHREAGGFAWVTPEGWRRDVKTGAEVHYTSPDGKQELVA
jgi:serine/threonine protein kinase